MATEGNGTHDKKFELELECTIKAHLDKEKGLTSPEFCPRTWDSLLCWPPTRPGSVALQPCFSELNGIPYDTTQNASRLCGVGGEWVNHTNYADCHDLNQQADDAGIVVTTAIYFAGYSISLIALCLAIWIFLYFKDLRCLRNTIHTNLMSTYILTDFMWLLTITSQMFLQTDQVVCAFLIVILHYFHLTNIYWMFVEGLYLYILVVETFTRENIKLRMYIIIGWGIPVLIVAAWAVAKSLAPTDLQVETGSSIMRHDCRWMSPHAYDWIYQVPAVLVLGINFIFLISIMWVLITKLRSANNAETQQYRKATKALIVLIPLLGITYVLVIAGPTTGVSANIYAYVRAVLLSTQGFLVAIFYCFLNTEVQNTVKHHMERWREARELGASGRRYTFSKDWSPNTRTESIRYQAVQLTTGDHRRESLQKARVNHE
ncbi:diuretic hormone receptor isoform X2 [Bemisia tabaci]|uniref:diuretic hormone receptor isoform X2 n=1 Tax=Bemisia tabaci TaxID=7038 RepID=UPI003B28754C